ncbi:hypothetical protein P9112_004326 [Eukaryota sp. TZLM1-RC]
MTTDSLNLTHCSIEDDSIPSHDFSVEIELSSTQNYDLTATIDLVMDVASARSVVQLTTKKLSLNSGINKAVFMVPGLPDELISKHKRKLLNNMGLYRITFSAEDQGEVVFTINLVCMFSGDRKTHTVERTVYSPLE